MLTSFDAIRAGALFPPTDGDRLDTYDKVDSLLSGDHLDVFRDGFARLMRDDGTIVEINLPWPRKLRLLFSDLLCGEPGTITASDESQQRYLDSLVRNLDLWRNIYECSGDTVIYGDGLFKLKKRNGMASLMTQPPSYWFPVVAEDDVREVLGHMLAWKVNLGTADTPKWVGFAEIHEPGYISTMRFEFDYSGERISRVTDQSRRIPTGVSGFLIFHAPNWRTSRELFGHSILDDADSLLSEIEVRLSQMSRVLDKHSDPGMYGPEAGLEQDQNGEWHVKGGQFYAVGEGETPPGYVTWDGQLFPNLEFLKFLREEWYTATDTSPALFGKMEQGMAESGSALKRLLISPLAAVNRLRLTYDSVVRDVLRTAAELEGVMLSDVTIGWKDGLPEDPMEAAQVEQTRASAGNTSTRSSVERLDGLRGIELERELERIESEKQAPPIGVPGGQMQGVPQVQDQTYEAQA